MAARSFKVPILLPADPTVALEAATKQYVDGKVVTPPAEAGPRSDVTTHARFGNLNAPHAKEAGYLASPDGGMDLVFAKGKGLTVWEHAAALGGFVPVMGLLLGTVSFSPNGTEMFKLSDRPHFYGNPLVEGASAAYDFDNRSNTSRKHALFAQGEDMYLYDAAVGVQFTVRNQGSGTKVGPRSGGWFGRHPIHTGHIGFWSGESASEAWFLTNSGEALINAAAGYTIGLRINQAGILDLNNTEVISYRKIRSYVTSVSSSWSDAAVVCYAANSGVDNCRVALNGYGVAPQIRGHTAEGDTVSGINQTSGGYCPFKGLAYVTVSTRTRKKNVRTFGGFRREHRKPKKQNWESDVVPDDINIMDLRPVAFRHTEPAWVINDDKESVPRSLDTILGRQGAREHLGLIAEEVAEVIPTAVVYDDNKENPGIDYSQITVALLEHVQRLTEEVATLRYRIAELEKA